MKELKNKKTGKIEVISEEEYAEIKDSKILSRFTVTDLKLKPLIPSIKEKPKAKK